MGGARGRGLAGRGKAWPGGVEGEGLNGSARRRCPLNWNGKQLPVGVTRPGAADPRLERPAWNPWTVSKKLRERVGVSESVARADGELVCVWARGTRWQDGRRRERSRGAAETTSAPSGEGLCARGTSRGRFSERTREGLSGPATSAPPRRPAATLPGRAPAPSASAARGTAVLRRETGQAGLAVSQWALDLVRSVPTPFQELVLLCLLFRKLLTRFFLLFFPRLLHSSAHCFPVGCHHNLVNEKLGNFPEGHGENGWQRRKEQKQTRC